MTIKAIEIFRSRDSHSFEIAIAALLGIMRDSWEPDEYGSDETPFTPDAFSLLRSIKTQVLDWQDNLKQQLQLRPKVHGQASGEALDPVRMEHLCRYEVHLNRKFERTFLTLLKLQQLRQGRNESGDH